MKSRHWGLALGLSAAVVLAGLASAGAFRPRAAVSVEGQLEGKKAPPRPAAQLKPEAARAEEAAIRKANEAFSAAFNKGDLDALLALWADDAEYTTEAGKTYRGKEQIKALLKKALAAHKGSKQSIRAHSVRLIKPDVALEEGTVTVTSPDGTSEPGRYSAVYAKHGGAWLIASIRDLPTPDDETRPNAYNRLRGLAWLVGQWVDKESARTITVNTKWSAGETFLMQEIVAVEADGKEMRLTHVIGWDPLEETVRGWLFDGAGGFSEGVWQREGNSWVAESQGWFGDGRAARATVTWKYVDDNTMTWSSENRQADEQPLPDLKITFVRKVTKGK